MTLCVQRAHDWIIDKLQPLAGRKVRKIVPIIGPRDFYAVDAKGASNDLMNVLPSPQTQSLSAMFTNLADPYRNVYI